MKYIKITNKGTISRSGIELLGFSSKRNDDETIGEKGTGLKFSRLQALRYGLQVYVSTDKFINWLETESIDKENDRVIFKYKDQKGIEEVVNSNYTLMAGYGDWNNDWYMLREMLQNAIDETLISEREEAKIEMNGIEVNLGVLSKGLKQASEFVISNLEVVTEVDFAEEGHTNIYLQHTAALETIIRNIETYINYQQVASNKHGLIKPKRDENFRIYKKGILVHEGKNNSIYDYDLVKIELSESRQIKDNNTTDLMGEILSEADVEIKREVLRALSQDNNKFRESDIWQWDLDKKDEWIKAFKAEFPVDEIVLHKERNVLGYYAERLEMLNKSLVVLPTGFYEIIKDDPAILTLAKLEAKPSFKFELVPINEIPEEQINLLADSMKLAKQYFHWSGDVSICRDMKRDDVMGAYDISNNTIYLSQGLFKFGRMKVLQVLIEELIHATTKADDKTRGFQNAATNIVADLLTMLAGRQEEASIGKDKIRF